MDLHRSFVNYCQQQMLQQSRACLLGVKADENAATIEHLRHLRPTSPMYGIRSAETFRRDLCAEWKRCEEENVQRDAERKVERGRAHKEVEDLCI